MSQLSSAVGSIPGVGPVFNTIQGIATKVFDIYVAVYAPVGHALRAGHRESLSRRHHRRHPEQQEPDFSRMVLQAGRRGIPGPAAARYQHRATWAPRWAPCPAN